MRSLSGRQMKKATLLFGQNSGVIPAGLWTEKVMHRTKVASPHILI